MRHDEKSYDDSFYKLQAEMKKLSFLPHDNDQADKVWCDILWKAIEAEPSVWNAQTKDGIEFVFSRTVEGIYDSIQKYTKFERKTEIETQFYSKAESTNKITNHIISSVPVKIMSKIMTFSSIIKEDINFIQINLT